MTTPSVYERKLEEEEAVKAELEAILQLLEDAYGALAVKKNFRHNDRNNDFVGSEDDENAIEDAWKDLDNAIKRLMPLAGY